MMKFRMVSPTSVKTAVIQWFQCATPDGTRTILEGHEQAIFVLQKDSKIHLALEQGAIEIISINGGVLQIISDEILIILDA